MAKVCVLRTDGTNCDRETKHAFELAGGEAEIVHIKSLIKGFDPAERKEVRLRDYDILAIPGGFSHGDYIASGKIFARDLEHFLGDEVKAFVEGGKLVIGICNGFQVLVKYGLLPMLDGKIGQTATLTYNDSQRFECRWVNLSNPNANNGIWTRGIGRIDLPVAHGEGKFVADEAVIEELFSRGLVALQYADSRGDPTMNYPANPNGAMHSMAGISDPTGRIFGLMPHPERYTAPENHYLATLQKVLLKEVARNPRKELDAIIEKAGLLPSQGRGLAIFRNGVDYFK